MDAVQVEKRGCIWLVRLLSPNTCTPSTQQPNRHFLSERCLAPNSFPANQQPNRLTSNCPSLRDRLRSWVISYQVQMTRQRCSCLWCSAPASISRVSTLSATDQGRSLSKSGARLVCACLPICRRHSLGLDDFPTSNTLSWMPVRPTLSL